MLVPVNSTGSPGIVVPMDERELQSGWSFRFGDDTIYSTDCNGNIARGESVMYHYK